jgi:hypothetical protein
MGRSAYQQAQAQKMDKHCVGPIGFDKIDQQETQGNVLGEVRVHPLRTQHCLIAGVADRDLQVTTHAKRSNAEREEHQRQYRGGSPQPRGDGPSGQRKARSPAWRGAPCAHQVR